jgi:pyruvate dehydrogenase E2 component (dihydrolipoamide acetyltransferase)
MAVPIRLPDMGTNVEECKVHSWRVQVGQRVKRGDVLAEIETDKAVAELESTAEGVVLSLTVEAGDSARTGDVLAYVGQPGEAVPTAAAAPAEDKAASPVAAPAPGASAPPRKIAPVVRNLAAKLGVDLDKVHGTGAGGVITREDVLAASRAVTSAATPGETLSRGQAAVARAVARSWKEIPHLYVTVSLDMTAARRLRAEAADKASRPSFDAILLKALACAVEAVPVVAARLEGERIVRADGVHIALAISSENDLFLPVIRDVNRKDLSSVQTEISSLAAQVRAGSLGLDRMTGACLALSNLGMYPVEDFEGIIFPEHSAILTLGATQETPVAVAGRVEIRPVAKATLAADHRLINGRTAAQFLSKLKQAIESGDFAR